MHIFNLETALTKHTSKETKLNLTENDGARVRNAKAESKVPPSAEPLTLSMELVTVKIVKTKFKSYLENGIRMSGGCLHTHTHTRTHVINRIVLE